MGALPDLGDVTTADVATARFTDLQGPWVALAGPLQGELFFEADGYCYFRPGDSLGYGGGVVQIRETAAGVATVSVDLEVYRYAQESREPPAAAEQFKISAVLTRATASKQQYSTLTLNGHLSQGTKNIGQFNAAKMDPWTPGDTPRFSPNRELEEGFRTLFPNDINLSHLNRPRLDLAKYKVGDVSNVYYVPDYVSAQEEAACLQQLAATPKELKRDLDRRVVQEYGGTMCQECNASFVPDLCQPPWTSKICDALVHDGVFTPATFPNNVRIHEYAVGHGIAPHVDGPIYVPKVAILSLQSTVVMGFYPYRKPYDDAMEHYNDTFRFDSEIAKGRPHFSVVLEPRSLLIFDSDAYYFHPHGISDKPVDSLREEDAGPIVNRHLLRETSPEALEVVRQPRVGVTIRNLLPRCSHQPERAEHAMRRFWQLGHPGMKPSEPSGSHKAATPPQPQQTPKAPSKPAPAMSTAEQSRTLATPPQAAPNSGSSTSAELAEVHRKLDQIMAMQRELQDAVKQLQVITAHSATQGASFQSEVSGVLDHLTAVIMDVQAQTTPDDGGR